MRLSYAVGLLLGLLSREVLAQFSLGWTTPDVEVGQSANLYVHWEGGTSLDGFFVDLPLGWHLERVSALRHGFMPMPVSLSAPAPGSNRYQVTASRPVRGMHEFILNVRTGGFPRPVSWSITPTTRVHKEGLVHLIAHEGLRMTRSMRSSAPTLEADNLALEFTGDGPGWLLRPQALPELGLSSAFTIEGWIWTTDLDRVIMSTWDGDEDSTYPVELMVDASGRLRYYRSDQGKHVSMASEAPIADGQWHHFALTHNPDTKRTHLYLDGMAADSLYSPTHDEPRRRMGLVLGHRFGVGAEHSVQLGRLTGLLDEIRIWPDVRPAREIRRTMRQTLPHNAENGVVLTFDRPSPPQFVAQIPTRASRVRSTLTFYTLARGFQGFAEPEGVHLSWRSHDPHTTAFILERSLDGQLYSVVRELAGPASPEYSRTGESNLYTYVDSQIGAHVAFYRLRQRFDGGAEQISGTIKLGLRLPEEPGTLLMGNFPNPFNPSTTITYEVQKAQHVRMSVWDLSGHRISVLVDKEHQEGTFAVPFDGSDLPSGTYFIRLQSVDGPLQTHKMILMK